MYQVCYHCGQVYGEKEPLEDKEISHGLCPECLPVELKELEEELERSGAGPLGRISNAVAQEDFTRSMNDKGE